MHSRLRALLARAARKSAALSCPSVARVAPIADYTTVANAGENYLWSKHRILSRHSVVLHRRLCGYSVEKFSDDEYECDYESHPVNSSSFSYNCLPCVWFNALWIPGNDLQNLLMSGITSLLWWGNLCINFSAFLLTYLNSDWQLFEELVYVYTKCFLLQASSSVANIDEWKWKLSMLLRNDKDQEIVSRDKRDKRDFEQISNLAKRMGLYWYYPCISLVFYAVICWGCLPKIVWIPLCSELYGKVVVASKVPLPNYRPDLDDKRPQREVRKYYLGIFRFVLLPHPTCTFGIVNNELYCSKTMKIISALFLKFKDSLKKHSKLTIMILSYSFF